jgi:hypothetical protein
MKTRNILIIVVLSLLVVGGGIYLSLRDAESRTPVEEDASETPSLTLENTQVEEGLLRHSEPTFSFSYPAEWVVTSFEDAEGETVLLRDRSTNGDVQLYLTPFDEAIVLTAARIKQDLPSLSVIDPLQVEIGKRVSGVYFKSVKEGIGEAQEVWFVHEGFLYQITAVKTHPKALADILASFKF